MGKSRPPHCSKECPFWESCATKAEGTLRVAECSCLMAAVLLRMGHLRKLAAYPAQARNVVILTLASAHWIETGRGRKTWQEPDHIVHIFVPLSVIASWAQLLCAKQLRFLGGCSLVGTGLYKLYTTEDPTAATELANDALGEVLPEPASALLGVLSGAHLILTQEN